ncbi:MAG TPA: polysaccharide pyruvyl transferase family protein [Gemmatimonadales bacterium]|jgi:succinoglycan biosynthesis protein ExoV|nr:polysaccharide pyruvyl transferase family protein [Gemmatimonadales bacterium]
MMRIHYFHDSYGNFGDDLNLWLWPRVLPGSSPTGPDPLLLGIGTVLHARHPRDSAKVVLGAGVGYGELPEKDETWHFYAVRGPGTAAALGLDPALAMTDAAALIARLLPPGHRRGPPAFMPHHKSRPNFRWPALCARLGWTFLDPWAPVERTLEQISGSRCVIAEAMHGAIVADALRVPWVAVHAYDHINEFKWEDWCGSLQMSHAPVRVASLYDRHRSAPHFRLADYARHSLRNRRLTREGAWELPAPSDQATVRAVEEQLAGIGREPSQWHLSNDGIFQERVAALHDALCRVRADWMSPAAR